MSLMQVIHGSTANCECCGHQCHLFVSGDFGGCSDCKKVMPASTRWREEVFLNIILAQDTFIPQNHMTHNVHSTKTERA